MCVCVCVCVCDLTQLGPVATAFHLSVDFLTVGCFYLAIRSGVDVKAVLAVAESTLGVSVPVGEGASTFAVRASTPPRPPHSHNASQVAYAMTTALTGIPRTLLTIAVTPAIARRIGYTPSAAAPKSGR